WPTWITNLAAPDMLFEWGRSIPLISRDADYGGLFYLGPDFNLLPIFTGALVVMQQKRMTPPAAGQAQGRQQKMMGIMMVRLGRFFYKRAAGLCVYIITSTLWGFAERKLLPKSSLPKVDDLDKKVADAIAADRPGPAGVGSTAVTTPPGVTTQGRKP